MKCPYCPGEARFLPSSETIYNGIDYGPVFVCYPCQAWVGCHPGTQSPLGRLANKELREWKMKVHRVFDPIWEARYKRRLAESGDSYRKSMARGGRYKRLAELMGIPRQECHIGMFDVERCKLAVQICSSGALEA